MANTDTNISAIYGSINNIPKTFKSCFLLHYQKYNVIYALPFFQKLQKSGFMSSSFSNCSKFNILLSFLINLINDDAFVSAVTADTCSVVHLVCLLMKTHLLALLRDNCLDLICCAFLCKLSASCQNLLRLIKAVILADTDILVKPQYQPGRYILADIIGLSLINIMLKSFGSSDVLDLWQL